MLRDRWSRRFQFCRHNAARQSRSILTVTTQDAEQFVEITSTAPFDGSGNVNFPVGTFILTRASLYDSPSRYVSIIEDAMAEVARVRFF